MALTGMALAWTATVSAQPWRHAYDRQDYAEAATLLQAAVFEHPAHGGSRYPDLEAIQTLAQFYAEGRGVPQDGLTACALSNLGSGAAVYAYGERDTRTVAVRRQVETYCVPLTAGDRREAMQASSCLQPAPASRVLLDSAARRVEIDRWRLAVTERGRAHELPLDGALRCPQQIALARHVRVPAPRGSKLPAREFVEIYSWHSHPRAGVSVRALEWSAVELTRQSAVLRARTVLLKEEGSAWPARGIPETFAKPVKYTMHKSGDVRWQIEGQSKLHGLIGRPSNLRAQTR